VYSEGTQSHLKRERERSRMEDEREVDKAMCSIKCAQTRALTILAVRVQQDVVDAHELAVTSGLTMEEEEKRR
jgi:hypothetical protein